MKYLTFCFCMLIKFGVFAQANSVIPISFNLIWDDSPLIISESSNKSKPLQIDIEVFKLYISHIELFDKNELIYSEENSYHLLDAEEIRSLEIPIKVPENISFSQIKFAIGVDSLTNVSGAFGGDLDPMYGMYWTWQSGYINFKLEGTAENCPNRHNRFQFHIGGYASPFNALQTVKLEVVEKDNINIVISIDQIFKQIDVEKTYQIMSPNEKSQAFSQLIPSLFSISK